eukprot:TRINITY_DN1048_c0_g1_i4.p1 TRINITY_DN1048_c0_g1~~TRINITY_DN1048_c0_g1_i4.p1  ORF type:complete len:916 (-),score=255.19 TRINITY_DN1048_c0_g1_i4:1067-3814(-)
MPLFGRKKHHERDQIGQHPRVFLFKKGHSAGAKDMKELLGGKGANLCEMARIGLNVPPGMTITTEQCQLFCENGEKLPEGLFDDVLSTLKSIEEAYGATFGDKDNTLLLSVRSGAAVSMPGMMDTVLNLGLNDEIVEGLAKQRGERFAFDCYRRLLDMYANVVLGVEHDEFEKELSAIKQKKQVKFDVDLDANDLRELVKRYEDVYKRLNISIPSKPEEQLETAIAAVFKSWNTPRAVKYREVSHITGLRGTAVNIQSMVYGNANENSGTGVCFTRNPSNGTKELFGEYLMNAQGEDVVSGIRTPLNINEMAQQNPKVYKELSDTTTLLEKEMQDMQDIEFTIQDGQLFMLQTRNGKRTGVAALRIALSMQEEHMVTKPESILMVEPKHLDQLLHPQFANPQGYKKDVVATGLAASPGAAVGRVVFLAGDAEKWHENGEKVILLRTETSPEDVGGMHAAEGILTSRGGMTSHAAVVARGWGKPCVCGCDAIDVSEKNKVAKLVKDNKTIEIREGDWISINGMTGEVIMGKQETKPPEISGDLEKFMKWVDQARRLGVLANADTAEDANVARNNGAEGIGLTRTEHMFFSSAKRIAAIRRMIAASELQSEQVRVQALQELVGYQREDFEGIFKAMDGLPVTIRLLDPPLHEFLPHEGAALDNLCAELAKELKVKDDQVKARLQALHEANPMMGFRGCRLGIVHPEITEMQVKAIISAAINVGKTGVLADPHIMVPLVGTFEELKLQKEVAQAIADKLIEESGSKQKYKIGTMIEVPRGALQADKLASIADFFSFGTNDLTQMTYGFSRDDAEAKFLPKYVKAGVLTSNPFDTIDQEGVGELIKIAVQRGREVKNNIELGICGEHGGDPSSVRFFHNVGLDYVSCSPLRVPIARLAAAQAALKSGMSRAESKKHATV